MVQETTVDLLECRAHVLNIISVIFGVSEK